ncbi:MAG: outer membrane protein assembly factor BamE [Pseudomonadota bacterium]|nr:outer membrane protein assembly factor BamE [Pseudomonadota bacterium]
MVKKILVLAAITFCNMGCSPTMYNHGNFPENELIKSIQIGKHSREQVTSILGPPSTVATFDQETWFYVSSKKSVVAFLQPKLIERNIFIVRFDPAGIVQKLEHLDKKDGRDIHIVERKTPTSGKELTFLEQLVGNIGRFSNQDSDGGVSGP